MFLESLVKKENQDANLYEDENPTPNKNHKQRGTSDYRNRLTFEDSPSSMLLPSSLSSLSYMTPEIAKNESKRILSPSGLVFLLVFIGLVSFYRFYFIFFLNSSLCFGFRGWGSYGVDEDERGKSLNESLTYHTDSLPDCVARSGQNPIGIQDIPLGYQQSISEAKQMETNRRKRKRANLPNYNLDKSFFVDTASGLRALCC